MVSFIMFAMQYLIYVGGLSVAIAYGIFILFNADLFFIGTLMLISFAIAICFAVCLFYYVTRDFIRSRR